MPFFGYNLLLFKDLSTYAAGRALRKPLFRTGRRFAFESYSRMRYGFECARLRSAAKASSFLLARIDAGSRFSGLPRAVFVRMSKPEDSPASTNHSRGNRRYQDNFRFHLDVLYVLFE